MPTLDVKIARINMRYAAPLMRLAQREARARNTAAKAAKAKLLAEQPARLQAYVDAVLEWCNTPKRKRKQTPSPSIADFGIINEPKAIDYLFNNITVT
jgi:hypothetical protein